MGRFTLDVEYDTHTPGLVTTAKQELDLSAIDSTQLNRCINAVMRRRTPQSGLVANIVTACAKHLGTSTPPVVEFDDYKINVRGLDSGEWFERFADMITVSDVRWQLFKANNNVRTYERDKTSGWADSWYRTTLVLYGWTKADRAKFDKQFAAIINSNKQLNSDCERLISFMKQRPKFEVFSRAYS